MKVWMVVSAALLVTGAASAAPLARPASFVVCGVCHKAEAGAPSGIGPNLWGVGTRVSGTLPGYTYSAAMKAAAIKWDKASIDDYLVAPQKKVPGTKMAYGGQPDPAKRAEIAAYLMSLK